MDRVLERVEPLFTIELPTGNAVSVLRRRFEGGDGPRVAVVAGLHGDAPEGIRVVHELTEHLRRVSSLDGCVDLYPCLNPLAAHRGARRWPFFDVDLQGRFPGRPDGHLPDRLVAALTEALRGAELVVELRSPEPAITELLQAQVRAGFQEESALALETNVEVVWERTPGRAFASSLAAQVPHCIALEGGRGNWLTAGVASDLAAGVLNLLARMGLLPETEVPVHWAALNRPQVVTDEDVVTVRAEEGGYFLPAVGVGDRLPVGELLGQVVDPLGSAALERIASPGGRVLALREQPLVYPGSVVAKVILDAGGEGSGRKR